jgi:hypothetical protein
MDRSAGASNKSILFPSDAAVVARPMGPASSSISAPPRVVLWFAVADASAVEAATWTHRFSNSLIAADAERVEEAFQAKLAIIANTTDGPQAPQESERNRRARFY